MTITIDIKPELQAELTRQATARGVQVEPYAASLLEEAVRHAGPTLKTLTSDQLDQALHDIAQFSAKIPVLPDEAFSRD